MIEPPRADPEAIGRLSEKAGLVLERAREAALEPNHRKVLRRWTLTEVAELLGTAAKSVSLRIEKMSLPAGEREGKRRLFTLEEIHAIQESLGTLPRQRFAIAEPVVIAVANFKGGVGKTSTAVHLAQYFALRGYRTLAVDLDAQASLTGLFGLLPDTEVPEEKTVNPFLYGPEIGGDSWTGTLATAIQSTYWSGLDLLAANLSLLRYRSSRPTQSTRPTDSLSRCPPRCSISRRRRTFSRCSRKYWTRSSPTKDDPRSTSSSRS